MVIRATVSIIDTPEGRAYDLSAYPTATGFSLVSPTGSATPGPDDINAKLAAATEATLDIMVPE